MSVSHALHHQQFILVKFTPLQHIVVQVVHPDPVVLQYLIPDFPFPDKPARTEHILHAFDLHID